MTQLPDRGSFIPGDITPPAPSRLLCRTCGYDLTGLDPASNCPECGTPIAQSMTGSDLLVHSSPQYVASLHKGVFIVLAAIIVMILCFFGMFGGMVVLPLTGLPISGVQTFFTLLITMCGFASAWGWWLLSEPDPASREGMKGEGARRIVRLCTLIGAALGAAAFIIGLFVPQPTFAMPGPMPPPTTPPTAPAGAGAAAVGVAAILSVIVSIISSLAGIVAYFAQMIYIRWLSPRLPDEWVFKRAKLLMWLGPVLYIFGAVCIGLGPLIALVLYWNMLDRVRKDLKTIRQAQTQPPVTTS